MSDEFVNSSVKYFRADSLWRFRRHELRDLVAVVNAFGQWYVLKS